VPVDHLEEVAERYEQIERWQRIKEENFRGLSRNRWDKAAPFEWNYSNAYHKLALLGARTRLKKKYRSR
jgi:hypothetical protein